MHLREAVEGRLASEQSYFRQYLIREDMARLDKLMAMAPAHQDPAAFVAAGMKLGWTPDDRRTHELKPALEPLLLAIHQRLGVPPGSAEADTLDNQISRHWDALEQLRMDRLVGCLSRVPRPDDAGPG